MSDLAAVHWVAPAAEVINQPMNRDDHLSNEVSVDARITASGLSANAKSRAIAALDRLVGSLLDVPASKMESYASRIRARSRLEATVFDAAAEKLAGLIDNDADAPRLIDGLVASQMHLLVNKKSVAGRAVGYLAAPSSRPESEPDSDSAEIDPDWLNHFGGYAEKASSEKVQDLWARVLAGEVRHPGSFSLTTLRLLAELDQKMASWFQEETEFRIMGKYILHPHDYSGGRLERLVFLEEVGLLHHVAPSGGIAHTFKPGPDGIAGVFEGNLCLRIHIDREVKLKVIPITRVGKEIAAILPPVDPRSVFRRLANALSGEVKSMDICQVLEEQQDHVRVSDPIEILRPATPDSG